MEIAFETKHSEAKRAIYKGLRAFNDRALGRRRMRRLISLTLREKGAIVGGVTGEVFGEWLFIRLLLIDEAHRGGGYGEKLMKMILDEARKKGAKAAQVDTLSFQAPKFYEKMGFTEFGRLDDYPTAGHTHHWLSKTL